MIKTNKSLLIMIILTVQTFVSLTTGLFVLYIAKKDYIPPNSYVDSLYVGEKSKNEAIKVIKDKFNTTLSENELVINFENRDYKIPYSDLDAYIDYDATLNQFFLNKDDVLSKLVKGYFLPDNNTLHPVIKVNDNKLRKKLQEIKKFIDRSPTNASMYLENEKVVKNEGITGADLNIDNTVNTIKKDIGELYNKSIKLGFGKNSDVDPRIPEITINDLYEVDGIISTSSTEIKSEDMQDYILKAASIVDAVKIPQYDKKDPKTEFSFKEYFKAKGINIKNSNDGYNQVASTMYVALLKTGISMDDVERVKNSKQIDYIALGLDVKIDENSDLKFRNKFDFPIVIFSQVKDNKLNIYIAGNKENTTKQDWNIKTEIEQRYQPSIFRVVNYDLAPGEQRLISSGRPGVKVKVIRTHTKNGAEKEEILYTDKYNAVEDVVQIGPEGDDK